MKIPIETVGAMFVPREMMIPIETGAEFVTPIKTFYGSAIFIETINDDFMNTYDNMMLPIKTFGKVYIFKY
jgi:hypothetical protein